MNLPQNLLAGARLPCPHCGVTVLLEAAQNWPTDKDRAEMGNQGQKQAQFILGAGKDKDNPRLYVSAARCPNCQKAVVAVVHVEHGESVKTRARFAWPEGIARKPIPESVPPHIAEDYREAVLVIPYSPKASAALSRRCLQHLLHEKGFVAKSLEKEIDAALPALPPHIQGELHTLRQFGNFAAHPSADHASGEILGVEDGEAEWMIEVLEDLFEHFYRKPDEARSKRDAINAKLVASGKKPLPSA